MSNVQIGLLKDQHRVEAYRGWLFTTFVAWVVVASVAMIAGLIRWNALAEEEAAAHASADAARAWNGALATMSGKLDALARLIAASDGALATFTEGKHAALLSAVSPWVEGLRSSRHLTALTFIGADHRVALRTTDGGRYGDTVDSPALADAERGRRAVSAFHVQGSSALFELVSPLLQGGRVIGFLVLGLDLDAVVAALADARGLDAVVVLRKDLPEFASGGHGAGWDRFPDAFVAAESRPGLAAALSVTPAGDALTAARRSLTITALPLTDGAGRPIGHVDIVTDDTERHNQAWGRTLIFATAVVAIAGLALGAAHLILFRLRPPLRISDQERRNLERVSQRDGLTGLFNRDAFEEQVAKELSHAHALNLPLSIMLIELDEGGELDEPLGRELEETVLLHVSATLQRQLRMGDVAARHSTRGFALMTQGVGGLLARDVAERLRRSVVATRIETPDGLVVLRACVGVSCFPERGATPALLIHEAERALAAARARGPNHSCVAGLDLVSPTG